MTISSRTGWLISAPILLAGCYALTSDGGGNISRVTALKGRSVDPEDVSVPPGYRVEAVVAGLGFPSAVTFGARGEMYIVEAGYSYDEIWTTPRVVEYTQDGRYVREVVRGSHAPWTGAVFHDGALFIAQGGVNEGGRIVRVDPASGATTVLVDGLPSHGDHHTNGPAVGKDGYVYFGVGTYTNSGVVGVDNHEDDYWLARHPDKHDIPCKDVTLSGLNFESDNPLTEEDDKAVTGAFLPFGTAATAGQVVPGKLPCSGAVMRVAASGGAPELVAWGFRNPYALAFGLDGALYVADNGYDVRGSRPVFGSADVLWKVQKDKWYGWPDFSEGRSLVLPGYSEQGGDTKGFVLASHPGQPPPPVAYFAVHSSADGIDFSRNPAFGYVGDAFVALFGDMTPNTGQVMDPVGFKVVRVDTKTGFIEDFIRNSGDERGPASLRKDGGLERPLSVRFDPTGTMLYVVDFGVMRVDPLIESTPATGVLWRVTKGE